MAMTAVAVNKLEGNLGQSGPFCLGMPETDTEGVTTKLLLTDLSRTTSLRVVLEMIWNQERVFHRQKVKLQMM